MARPRIVLQDPRTRRKMRMPTHSFSLESRPWQLVPCAIAPVLPGETLKNANVQARIVADPLATGPAALIPWWSETYLFYVKLRDLDIRNDVENALLKGTALPTNATASVAFYHAAGQVDWLQLCYKRIVEEFFRDEGEAWNSAMIDSYAAVSAVKRQSNWADSLTVDTVGIPDPNDLQVPHSHDVLTEYAEMYEQMRSMQMIDMSFEEWLKTYGITGPEVQEPHKPELIRHTSAWTYPTNTVNPVDGIPNTAVSWSLNERADKDRFFKEPGFLVLLKVERPKVYLGNQKSTAVAMLNNALAWLPALMRDEPHTSLKALPKAAAFNPMGATQTNDTWVDLRDLFLYGDQFINYAAPGNVAPALPSAASEMRYATSAMATALFKASGSNKIRTDGLGRFAIMGHATTAQDNT